MSDSGWGEPLRASRMSREDRLAAARAALCYVEARQDVQFIAARETARGFGRDAGLVGIGGANSQGVPTSRGVWHVPPSVESLVRAIAQVVTEESWTAVAGVSDIGWEAAKLLGVDPQKVVVVPNLKQQIPKVVGSLVEGFEVVALGDVALSPSNQRALAARVRKLNGTILTLNPWPTISRPFERGRDLGIDESPGARLQHLEVSESLRHVGVAT